MNHRQLYIMIRLYMKFQLISDLHLEFYKDLPNIKDIITPEAPNLILAGDICFIKHKHFVPFFEKIAPLFKRIIYVLGNHEYYIHSDLRMESISTMVLNAKTLLTPFKNVYLLDNNYLLLEGNIVILGCTLWSYLSKKDFVCGMTYLSSVSFVRHKNTTLLKPSITNKLHLEQKRWLTDMLDLFADKKIIVVTHYVPTIKGIDEKYSFFNKAYYSNCDELVYKADIWCCGHTHEQKIIHVGETPLYINALGKPSERKDGPQNIIFII